MTFEPESTAQASSSSAEATPNAAETASAASDATPAPPEADSGTKSTDQAFAELSSTLLTALARVEAVVEERLAAADRSSTIIDRLHDELQGARQKQDLRRAEPTLRSLIRLRDDMQLAVDRERASGTARDDLLRSVELFRLQVEEVLYREGAISFTPDLGTPFDGKWHQIVAVVAVAEQARDRTVLTVRQPGFIYDERVLRPALVDVARFTADAVTPPTKPNPPEK